MGSGGGQGKAVLLFDIWLHSEVILFYPTLSSWCNSLNKKAQKELYERWQKQIGDEAVLFYFPLFPGFNNHSMGKPIFPEYNWNGWIPQSRCLKIRPSFLGICVSSSGILKLQHGVSRFWEFVKVQCFSS